MGAQLELVPGTRTRVKGRNARDADREVRRLRTEGRPLTVSAAALLRSSAEALDRAQATARREPTPYASSVEAAAVREHRGTLDALGLLPGAAGEADPDDALLAGLLGDPTPLPHDA